MSTREPWLCELPDFVDVKGIFLKIDLEQDRAGVPGVGAGVPQQGCAEESTGSFALLLDEVLWVGIAKKWMEAAVGAKWEDVWHLMGCHRAVLKLQELAEA